ncbi:hypothetical protein AB205_0167480, partial [Aquarana catesbeiana]
MALRGPAASVSTGKGGHGQSLGRASFPLFSDVACAIQAQHAEEVDWLTKPSSSSSSVTPAETSAQSTAAARVAYSASLSTATPVIAPASGIEESAPQLFEHSTSHLLLDNAQPLLDSDLGSAIEEGRNMSLQKGENTGKQQIGSHVPPAATHCQVVSSDNEDGGDDDDEVTDMTWVLDRAEEESEGETQPLSGSHHGRVESSHPIPPDCGAIISQPTFHSSAVWSFFSTCAADCTVAICKLCLKHIKHGKSTSHLGTTCLTRHLTSHHSACWQEHLKVTQKGSNFAPRSSPFRSTPAIPHDLSTASTDRDDGIVYRVSQ